MDSTLIARSPTPASSERNAQRDVDTNLEQLNEEILRLVERLRYLRSIASAAPPLRRGRPARLASNTALPSAQRAPSNNLRLRQAATHFVQRSRCGPAACVERCENPTALLPSNPRTATTPGSLSRVHATTRRSREATLPSHQSTRRHQRNHPRASTPPRQITCAALITPDEGASVFRND